MRKIFVRNAFNYDMDKASRDSGLSCSDPSRTQQQFKDECDINTIVRNFGVTGLLPQRTDPPLQGDFTNVIDYQSAMNLIIDAQAAFGDIPSDIRKRFHNDPAEYLDFISDPNNEAEARKMGLLRVDEPPPPPVRVQMVLDPSLEPEPPKGAPKGSKNPE